MEWPVEKRWEDIPVLEREEAYDLVDGKCSKLGILSGWCSGDLHKELMRWGLFVYARIGNKRDRRWENRSNTASKPSAANAEAAGASSRAVALQDAATSTSPPPQLRALAPKPCPSVEEGKQAAQKN